MLYWKEESSFWIPRFLLVAGYEHAVKDSFQMELEALRYAVHFVSES